MKKLIYLISASLISLAAQAVPFTCISDEKMGEANLLRFKIGEKVSYTAHDDKIWKLHLIGITPASGNRKIVYGSGNVGSDRITLTFVKDDFVLGSVNVQLNKKKGYFTGTASIDIVNNNEVLPVKCISTDKVHLIDN